MIKSIYKFLTYCLLLPAVFLSMMAFASLLMAFVNPGILFFTFLIVGVIIYTVCCYIFSQKVLQLNQKISLKLKDWLKVNAIVTVVFSVMMIFNFFKSLLMPFEIKKVISEMVELQKGKPNFYANEIVLYNLLMGVFVFFAVYGLILITHIICGVKLIKEHQSYFNEEL